MTYAKQKLPFTLYMTGEQESAVWKPVTSDFFALLIADILRFYEHRTVSFDMAEILEVMRIREGALKAAKTPDQWLTL